jgi:hypothetical protein
MNTIENMREVGELLINQSRYREAYIIYDELYKQMWSVLATIQDTRIRYSSGLLGMLNRTDNSIKLSACETTANSLCLKMYNINLGIFINEFIKVIYGRLQCECLLREKYSSMINDSILNEFVILYSLVIQPENQRKIAPIFAIATGVLDGNNRLKRVKSNYPKNMLEKLLVENVEKSRNTEWQTINHLLLNYLKNIRGPKNFLYNRISTLIGSNPFQSNRFNKNESYSTYERYERCERFERFDRFEKDSTSLKDEFHPLLASEEEKNIYYGKMIGLKGRVTKAQIRSKYIDMVSLYHPDKVQHLGSELRNLAELRTKEINVAYAWLKSKYQI